VAAENLSQLTAPATDVVAYREEAYRMDMASDGVVIGGIRYLRAPNPIHFPESAEVPESKLHLELCALLYALLKYSFAKEHSIGSDQFVYWDPTEPRACLAPDAFVRLGTPDTRFKTWKVWERGAPEVAVEIQSDSDEGEPWEAKLRKYPKLGVRELVAFDPQQAKMRVWDFVDHDLVERGTSGVTAKSNVLPGYWVVVEDRELGPALRLSHTEDGSDLFPTPAEAEAEARKAEAEARKAEAEARSSAEQRIRELEAELARRQG
jgi:Uma2 family endonuclease